MYGVNFTSAFHIHARRSALMDFHLSPLPTHLTLIIRGMRTNTREKRRGGEGMPGYAVKFMTSANISVGITRFARRLAAISMKLATIRHSWDNFSDYASIRSSSALLMNAIGETDRNPRRCKPRRIDFN